jgi:hypothetical protein
MAPNAYVELFLNAIRSQLGIADGGDRIAALDDPGASQDRLLEYARECFMAPLLYSQLKHAALRAQHYASAARKALLLELLGELAERFFERGIPFLLLKGAALEVALDLPPALRVMADLDLLVPPEALGDAEQVLAGRGLAPARSAANHALLRRRGCHLAPYVAPEQGVVELHREVLPRSAPFRLRPSALWKQSRLVPWRGREMRIPSAEHLFVHTCIHYGYWHTYGAALRRIWDLGLIVTRLPLDEVQLLYEADRCGAGRLVRAALWELQALREGEGFRWDELCRRILAHDDLWSEKPLRERLRDRARMLDRAPQRWTLYWSALLPAWEETANVTGCGTLAEHLGHFLHPRRLLRGLAGLRR